VRRPVQRSSEQIRTCHTPPKRLAAMRAFARRRPPSYGGPLRITKGAVTHNGGHRFNAGGVGSALPSLLRLAGPDHLIILPSLLEDAQSPASFSLETTGVTLSAVKIGEIGGVLGWGVLRLATRTVLYRLRSGLHLWRARHPTVATKSRREGARSWQAWKQEALVEPTDAKQYNAKADEGEALVDAGEIVHVD